MKLINNKLRRSWLFTFRLKAIHKYIVVVLALPLSGVSLAAAPARTPKITLIYTTAETSTSAEVVWNTNMASDSLLQYSRNNPVPANATQFYSANSGDDTRVSPRRTYARNSLLLQGDELR